MKTGRNDPCPCGSGKKYKNCHGRKSLAAFFGRRGVIAIFIVGIVGAGILITVSHRSDPTAERPNVGLPPPVSPRAGKVWSPEHGHWHDATGAEAAEGMKQTAPPPGEAPPGKVWSPEHGHWHDTGVVQNQAKTATSPVPQPPGPVPEGKVWSPEHGHWHNIVTRKDSLGGPPYPQPPGTVPEGKVWSPEHGHWHNILPEDKNAADTATAQPMQQPPHPPPDTSSTEPGE
jgi:hypothetical protein